LSLIRILGISKAHLQYTNLTELQMLISTGRYSERTWDPEETSLSLELICQVIITKT